MSRSTSSAPRALPAARLAECQRLHAESLAQPDQFWRREARALSWVRAPECTFEGDLSEGDVSWFGDGLLNVTESCVDRHAAATPDQPALVWLRPEGDVETLSYRALRQHMCRMANVLLSQGVRPADRVAVYLPVGVPLVVALLACARVGAVHLSVPVHADTQWLRRALRVARARLLVTADEADVRGARIPLWERADQAVNGLGRVEAVLVKRHTGARVHLVYARDHDLDRALALARPTCPPALLHGEDALLLAAAEGEDGSRPVVHSTAGFLLQALLVQREALGVRAGDRVLCLADVGGPRADVLFGALALGATLVLDERGEGLRHLEGLGATHVIARAAELREVVASATSRTTVLLDSAAGGTADVHAVWSSEAAGLLHTQWPGAGATATFGVEPIVLDARGVPALPGTAGELCSRTSWPAQPRTLESDHARFVDQRLRRFPGLYRTMERCQVLSEGGLAWLGRAHEPALVALSSAEHSLSGPLGQA
ncbi:MAG: AMP-binding protein [Myxococcaceae bacterium]